MPQYEPQGLTKNERCINPSKSHPHSFSPKTHKQIAPYYTNFPASVSFIWMVKSPWNHSSLKYPGNWLIVTIAWMFSKCFWVLTAWRRCTCHPAGPERERTKSDWPMRTMSRKGWNSLWIHGQTWKTMENMSGMQRKTLISSGIWFWQPNIEVFL